MASVSSKAASTPFMDSLQLEAANSCRACPVKRLQLRSGILCKVALNAESIFMFVFVFYGVQSFHSSDD
jgi:hypothetical protein